MHHLPRREVEEAVRVVRSHRAAIRNISKDIPPRPIVELLQKKPWLIRT